MFERIVLGSLSVALYLQAGCVVDEQPEAGKSSQAIVDGFPTEAPPWVVFLRRADDTWDGTYFEEEDNSDVERFFCTGSLIGPQWVLTAAHCLGPNGDNFLGNAAPSSYYLPSPEHYEIVAGKSDLYGPDGPGVERRFATKFFAHPGHYSSDTTWSDGYTFFGAVFPAACTFPYHGFYGGNEHDIALIKLDSPIELDYYPDLALESPPIGTQGTIMGYGPHGIGTNFAFDGLLHAGFVEKHELSACESSFPVAETHQCLHGIGAPDHYWQSSKGDSGGPWMTWYPATLAGVMALRSAEIVGTGESLYTDVAQHREWIGEVIKCDPPHRDPCEPALPDCTQREEPHSW